MKFTDLFITKETETIVEKVDAIEVPIFGMSLSEEVKAEDILRKAGYKIKLVTGTAFGVQIDLFKEPDADDIKKVLKNFNIKIKKKQLFIVL
jgi:hypothetical protein